VLVGFAEDLFNLGNGVRSAAEDVPSFIGNVLTFDAPGVVTDGRRIVGDVGDVLDGMQGLGVSLGRIPARYGGTVGKIADSPILSAAQLTIEGEKKLAGSGDPEQGNSFDDSAEKLAEAWETLRGASRDDKQWDGRASEAYDLVNEVHIEMTDRVRDTDAILAEILKIEAGQVNRTRETLDDTSQGLYDFGLSIVWMNVPPLKAAKMAVETAAAAAALATTTTTMGILAKNSIENARRIRECGDMYAEAAMDTSGDGGVCGTFVDPKVDTGGGTRPSRTDPNVPYTLPHPVNPPWFDAPNIPYREEGPSS